MFFERKVETGEMRDQEGELEVKERKRDKAKETRAKYMQIFKTLRKVHV